VTTPIPVESLVDYGPAIDAAIAKARTLNISPDGVDSPEMIARLIAAEVLRVATPLIAAAERDRILNLLTAWTCPCGEKDCAGYDTRDRLAELIEEDSR
jgi:hypothetical protein